MKHRFYNKKLILLWFLSVIIFAGFSIAPTMIKSETALNFREEVRSYRECIFTLQIFDSLCDQFETESWREIYGLDFWELGSLNIQLADLDRDGVEDLIVHLQHTGYCGSSGCSYLFFFGDTEKTAPLRTYSINSRKHPTLEILNGDPGLRFYEDGLFFSVEEIKEEIAKSEEIDLGG